MYRPKTPINSRGRLISGSELHDLKTTNVRAGVIPFTVCNSRIYFLLGIDRRTRELTDFGGGVKANENFIETGFRELHEESCKIFEGSVSKKDIQDSIAIVNANYNSVIFFVKIDSDWLCKAEKEFDAKQEDLNAIKKHNELRGVKWVQDNNFQRIAFDRKSQCMWSRIQNIIRNSTTWQELQLRVLFYPELPSVFLNSWMTITNKHLTPVPQLAS